MKLSERMRLPDEMFPEDFADEVAKLEAELADYKVGTQALRESVTEIRDERDKLEAENRELKASIVCAVQYEYNEPAARAKAESFGMDYDALLKESE